MQLFYKRKYQSCVNILEYSYMYKNVDKNEKVFNVSLSDGLLYDLETTVQCIKPIKVYS
jgi:hypothetical protein